MNKVILLGRLTKDVAITEGEKTIGRFTLAVDDGYGEKKKTYFPQIVCFDRLAVNCSASLRKGSKALVEGKLTTSSFEKDRQTVYTTNVVATNVEFLSPKNESAKAAHQPDAGDAFDSGSEDWGDEFSDITF